MDPIKAIVVVVITVGAVVLFNVILYLAFRQGREVKSINLTRKVIDRMKNPWKDEDDDLSELHRLVEEIQPTSQQDFDKPSNSQIIEKESN
jgi:hypothetical protein